jgi:fucose permease
MGGRDRPGLLVLAYLAFVSLGLPDAVLGLAWPSIREAFSLPQAALGAVLATAATAYFFSGLLAGRFILAVGIGGVLAASTGLVTLGLAGYASAPVFALFLAAACFIGFGSGAVDAGLNTYAAQHFGARHMTWLHAAYSTGAALGPVLMTALLARGAGWRVGYAAIGAVLGALAVTFAVTRGRWNNDEPASPASESEAVKGPRPTAWATFRRPRVLLQIATFFFYCGVEVTAGQWSYTVLTEARGVPPTVAGTWVSLYWASLLAGRVLLGFIVERVGSVRLLRLSTVAAVAGSLLVVIPQAPAALGLAVLGFALAPIFPGLMTETPRRIGVNAAAHAVGFQVSAATVGVAVVPSVAGLLGEWFGLAAIPPLVVLCAVVLLVLHEVLVATADRSA